MFSFEKKNLFWAVTLSYFCMYFDVLRHPYFISYLMMQPTVIIQLILFLPKSKMMGIDPVDA